MDGARLIKKESSGFGSGQLIEPNKLGRKCNVAERYYSAWLDIIAVHMGVMVNCISLSQTWNNKQPQEEQMDHF